MLYVATHDQMPLLDSTLAALQGLNEKADKHGVCAIVLMPETDSNHDIGHVKATKAPEGTAAGAATGAASGEVGRAPSGLGRVPSPVPEPAPRERPEDGGRHVRVGVGELELRHERDEGAAEHGEAGRNRGRFGG